MALALHQHHRARRISAATAPLPLAAAGLSLLAPGLDLVGQLQHVVPLGWPALVACGIAAVVQIGALAYRPSAGWLIAAALATGTSVILRLGGYPGAPALALLGVVALGTGGAFRSASGEPDLVEVRQPSDRQVSQTVESEPQPAAFPRAA